MNKTNVFTRVGMIAIAGLVTAGWLTLQAQSSDSSGGAATGSGRSGQGTSGQGQSGQNQSGQYRSTMGTSAGSQQVQKANKASELIGMNVKNAQGETIGEIKDVVIDFQSDRVGYVVLSSDQGVLTAEKLHAVPLRAFQIGADGSTVTLNVDKSKLANAQGFTKDNWPSPSNPSWGAEPFWQENDQQKQHQQNRTPGMTPGTPGSSTSPGSSGTPGSTDPNRR